MRWRCLYYFWDLPRALVHVACLFASEVRFYSYTNHSENKKTKQRMKTYLPANGLAAPCAVIPVRWIHFTRKLIARNTPMASIQLQTEANGIYSKSDQIVCCWTPLHVEHLEMMGRPLSATERERAGKRPSCCLQNKNSPHHWICLCSCKEHNNAVLYLMENGQMVFMCVCACIWWDGPMNIVYLCNVEST